MNYQTNTISQLHSIARENVRKLSNMTKTLKNTVELSLVRRDLYVVLTSYSKENCSINNSLHYDIDTRLFLSQFFTGIGFDKATGLLASLNIEGSVGTKQTFHNHQPVLTADIIKTNTAVIKEAHANEIKATILDMVEEKGIENEL